MYPRIRFRDKAHTMSVYKGCDITTVLDNDAGQPTNEQVGKPLCKSLF